MHATMLFRGGKPCTEGIGLGGPVQRTVIVRVSCGLPPGQIISVTEEGMCSYYVRFSHPLACGVVGKNNLNTVAKALTWASRDVNAAARVWLRAKAMQAERDLPHKQRRRRGEARRAKGNK